MAKVTVKKNQYNNEVRQLWVDGRLWSTVPAKEATQARRDLESQLARDPWYCERRGY